MTINGGFLLKITLLQLLILSSTHRILLFIVLLGYYSFFAAHPEQQAKFPKFASAKNLSGNAAFHAQTLAVTQYLDKMVKGDAVGLFKAKVADHAGRNVGDGFNVSPACWHFSDDILWIYIFMRCLTREKNTKKLYHSYLSQSNFFYFMTTYYFSVYTFDLFS